MEKTLEQRIKRLGLTCTVGDRQFINGIEVVDLGLPSGTLWAKCNLGAECETDKGTHHQFGYFKPYKETSKNYEFKEFGSINGFTVPTQEQFKELKKHTYQTFIEKGRNKGVKFTSIYDNTKCIFLPSTTYMDGIREMSDYYGYYWTSSIYMLNYDCKYGHAIHANYQSLNLSNYFLFSYGFSIRLVVKP